ncbi:MAG TPA: ABC transporter permease [Vicinamibacterales bacterium]|uniref:ABC transporter permease n=1 Tax=Sphaerobacter sp. TaxID=2099654 RepID=UPI001D3EC1C8|nr:ABC transporter permease [Sphaerobacter sp.]MBX5443843.1 ABC transporter permease [Sphaerobacter sp.]
MPLSRSSRVILNTVVALLYLFLLAPIIIVVIAAFNSGQYLRFPPEGFSLRWFQKFLESEPFVDAFLFSVRLAIFVTVLATVIGTAAALYIVRHSRRFRAGLQLLMISPLPVPAILTGIALLIFFYAIGLGTRGMVGLVIGHTLVSLPYVFLTVSTVLVGFDRSLEEAARNLGAGPWTTFRRVTLPLIKGGIISGSVFAFIVSFDQFPISLLLASVGSTPLPLQLFDYLRFSFDPTAAAVSTISILMTVVVVLITERLVGLESLYWGGR